MRRVRKLCALGPVAQRLTERQELDVLVSGQCQSVAQVYLISMATGEPLGGRQLTVPPDAFNSGQLNHRLIGRRLKYAINHNPPHLRSGFK